MLQPLLDTVQVLIPGLIHSRKSCVESPWVLGSRRPRGNSGEHGLHLEERIIHLWSYQHQPSVSNLLTLQHASDI